ncbi:hypothetical protein GCM10015535_68310 [Streptomyces gelaticus]|uniref:Uncharacterized protein n=1 Tax=Streptomyces gelaticus TaxID=285446 RepID=A0ABQ2W9X2_9ACTN|nr:hypothetical protein GCM10015535_68310 [Streptomyces gelaticus]
MSQQDSLAEQCEARPTEHPALEHLDPVDVSFDDAGVPGQGETRDDRVAVSVVNIASWVPMSACALSAGEGTLTA